MPSATALNNLLDANGVPITATRLRQLFEDADAVQTQFRTVVAALASPMVLNENGAPASSSPSTETTWSSLDAAGDDFDEDNCLRLGDPTTPPVPVALGSRRPRNIFAPVTPPAPQRSHDHSSPMSMTTVNSAHIVVTEGSHDRQPFLARLLQVASDASHALEETVAPGFEESDSTASSSDSSVTRGASVHAAAHHDIYLSLLSGECMDAQFRSIRQEHAVQKIAEERGLNEGYARQLVLPLPRHLLVATSPPDATSVRRRLQVLDSPFSIAHTPNSVRVRVSTPENETLFEFGFEDLDESVHEHWNNVTSWLEMMRRSGSAPGPSTPPGSSTETPQAPRRCKRTWRGEDDSDAPSSPDTPKRTSPSRKKRK
ncbi:hypothetical protein A1Q2_01096 [Trichosporon asahii var. asahii CBS 8904]|uniref:Uncharacterized protein n=1 Tax=Trichosporon asahii var. asahii (strain CBS 8904) TaxID=1220162 RepID=K1W6P7_TRIAC|nr:hypothetical protein A1Q2_01096 [Trichosporon asahii var. asahii CBS 8904]